MTTCDCVPNRLPHTELVSILEYFEFEIPNELREMIFEKSFGSYVNLVAILIERSYLHIKMDSAIMRNVRLRLSASEGESDFENPSRPIDFFVGLRP